jgi:hypothetical protein
MAPALRPIAQGGGRALAYLLVKDFDRPKRAAIVSPSGLRKAFARPPPDIARKLARSSGVARRFSRSIVLSAVMVVMLSLNFWVSELWPRLSSSVMRKLNVGRFGAATHCAQPG